MSRLMKGNTCAHMMNVSSTVRVLPRTCADVRGMLSVVFIGTASLDKAHLRKIFRVRKMKIWRFLLWLKRYNVLYQHVELDERVLSEYPEAGALPGIENRVIHVNAPADDLFEEETAGLSDHPAQSKSGSDSSADATSCGRVFLERFGVADPEGSTVLGRDLHAAAVRNVTRKSKNGADLYLSNSVKPVAEYDNPSLIPGMFPTLFPFGIGGLDDRSRTVPVSFRVHAEYLLDATENLFRKHHSFIFIILNIYLRRMCHLHTHLVVSRRNMNAAADKLKQVTDKSLMRLSQHLQDESVPRLLSDEDRGAFDLLNLVNAVSSNVPGSEASKLKMRNTVLAYSAFFGVPTLYFTINPNAQNSPIFQVMYGDEVVNLDSRFPELVNSDERAIRLAEDPVRGADFYQFCVTCVFRDLFGWDFEKGESGKEGILGRIKAFFGSDEFTNRGQLHGHFVIWLEGAFNPSVLHGYLRSSEEYRVRFFSFFDSIIKHDLPSVSCDALLDPDYDPRVQRPIPPPDLKDGSMSENDRVKAMEAWARNFLIDVKGCGEVLQRHVCKPVCHKYGNEGKCRFLFPHDFVQYSHFEEETNSIMLCVRDPTVNYYNPYILVFCRHNHDLKCILSGKSAKAAMMYITDYITKMDLKTYQLLSLLSKAVVNLARGESECEIDVSSFVRDDAKQFLHSCLTQFARQREVHAQQAVRIIRGFEGSWDSHKTTIMLSRALLAHVKRTYRLSRPKIAGNESAQEKGNGSKDDDDDSDEEELEKETVRIETDDSGDLIRTNQVWDYFLRDERLGNLNFYEFVMRFKLVKKKDNSRRVSFVRYALLDPHQLSKSHELMETNKKHTVVPRVYGCNVPRRSREWDYQLFALAHFKPFSVSNPLVSMNSNVAEEFRAYRFCPLAVRVMDNWDALGESEDARDQDRMNKKASSLKESKMLKELARKECSLEDTLKCLDVSTDSSAIPDFEAHTIVKVLADSGWFKCRSGSAHNCDQISTDDRNAGHSFPSVVSPNQMRRWRQELKHAENKVKQARRSEGTTADMSDNGEFETVRRTVTQVPQRFNSNNVRGTLTSDDVPRSLSDSVEGIRVNNKLNDEQSLAYTIIVSKYLELLSCREEHREDEYQPLRLFLTGPGGTGKTHVVKCVKEVMRLYNKAHTIRFLAPTGTAASLINGTTVHSGLGISIKSSDSLSGLAPNLSVQVSVKNKNEMRAEWKDVDVVLIDEVSMISLNLLGQIDHALRFVKEKPNAWFGGVLMIFSGDLYQYPPVRAPALYSSISLKAKMSNKELHKRIGALAWNSVTDVVELTEQHRMKGDPEYAAAVLRLRERKCTLSDALLFNSRLVRSESYPTGVDLSSEVASASVAIVPTNNQRKALNLLKSRSVCDENGNELYLCEALDVFADSGNVLPNDPPSFARDSLLRIDVQKKDNGSANLPGIVPLYVGMPVILKEKNISTDLGVTNGAKGTVHHITFKSFSVVGDRPVVDVVFVKFPDCKVQLSGLEKGVIPLSPISASFKANVQIGNSTSAVHNIKRYQLCVQPAFAVTGHSAQGQTLVLVITDLSLGGFSAYVAASRPKNRHGLAITKEVSVNDLNLSSDLPVDLVVETRRLSKLAHNTKIKYGYCDGDAVQVECLAGLQVPPGSEPNTAYSKTVNAANVSYTDADVSIPENKAKGAVKNKGEAKKKRKVPADDTVSVPRGKRKKKCNDLSEKSSTFRPRESVSPPSPSPLPVWTSFGCEWKENYSCAYDTFVMSLLASYWIASVHNRNNIRRTNGLLTSLCEGFEGVLTSSDDAGELLNHIRDLVRRLLSDINPTLFPAQEAALVPIGDLLNIAMCASGDSDNHDRIFPKAICDVCGDVDTSALQELYSLTNVRYQSAITDLPNERISRRIGGEDVVVSQRWLDDLNPFGSQFHVAVTELHRRFCRGRVNITWFMTCAPPVLWIEVPHGYPSPVSPSTTIRLPNSAACYTLSSVVFLTDSHYWSYMILNGFVWMYDGRQNGGAPLLLGEMSSIFRVVEDSVLFDKRQSPCILLYTNLSS